MNKGTDKIAEISSDKLFAALAYLGFLCILSLLLKKDNKFVLYHAKQGLVIFAFEVACFILSIIPLFNWLLFFGNIFLVLVSLWGIMQALAGRLGRIPVISQIAEKISL